MKAFKKLMSAIAATAVTAAVLLGSGLPVLAGTVTEGPTTGSITISTTEAGHTYGLYQIFTGDYCYEEENGQPVPNTDTLSNIKWGTGVSGTGITAGQPVPQTIIDALLADTNATGNSILDDLVAGTGTKASLVEPPLDTVSTLTPNVGYKFENVPSGYYLVQDITDPTGSETSENTSSRTSYIVQLVGGDITIQPKSVTPGDTKTVSDETGDSATDDTDADGFGSSADHEIGETFQFKLTATIPTNANFKDYDEGYEIIFHDTMSAGITYEGNMTVSISAGTDSKTLTATEYTLSGISDGDEGEKTFTITTNLRTVYGTDYVNFLSRHTNDNIVITVTYDAHLNDAAKVSDPSHKTTTNQNESYIEYSNNPNGEGHGSTTPHDVYVFTYTINVNKTDGSNNNAPLEGVKFTLSDAAGTIIPFVHIAGSSVYYADLDGKLVNTTDAGGNTFIAAEDNKLVTDAEGKISINGLDAGIYTLSETDPLPGFNTAEDRTITITATHGTTNTADPLTINHKAVSVTGVTDGNSITIQNNKGTTLPSTGGMGTTIFYIAGSVLVIAAAVILISRKRMSGSED